MTKFMKVLGSSSKALGFMGVLLPSMGLHTPQCLLLKDLTGSARYTRPPNPTACPPLLRVNLLLVLYGELFHSTTVASNLGEEEHRGSDPQPVGHMRLRM